jgi:hypothetical protein
VAEFLIVLQSAALGEWRTRIDADSERDALDRYLSRMGDRGVTRLSETQARFLDEISVEARPHGLRAVPAPEEPGPGERKTLGLQQRIRTGARR